jgi:3-methyl-2-oxobutanoate hydroxymethyltransferase
MRRKTVVDLQKMKAKNEKIAMVTAYDATMARLVDTAGVDMVLVGDSLGMVIQGMEDTLSVTLDDMVYHGRCVARGLSQAHLTVDMPFMSYQSSDERAVENAGRFIKEAGCDAIKLEGGVSCESRIKAIVDAGIAVFGHIGLTPQSGGIQGTLAQGRTAPEAKCLIEDAYAVQRAGAHYLLVEAVPQRWATTSAAILTSPSMALAAVGRWTGSCSSSRT